MKKGNVIVGAICLLSCGYAGSYELATHAYMTYRAFTRSSLNDPQSDLRIRLGFNRLDPNGPFAYERPYQANEQDYRDNLPMDPPTLPGGSNYSRANQTFERAAFKELLDRAFITAPADDPVDFGGATPSTPVQRFEAILPAWLMRGAIREDDIGFEGIQGDIILGNETGAIRDRDPWGEKIRVMNHFYDPIHNVPLTVLTPRGERATDWALGMTNALDVSEPEDTSRDQHFSLRDFYNNLYWALTLERPASGGGIRTESDRKLDSKERRERFATSLKSLGHVAHLLQDMAQPQH
jgi:hypothetical protein